MPLPVYFARQLVNERMLAARSRIPDGMEPTLGPVATAFGEIYQYLMEGDSADAMTKKTIHDWDIRTRLRSVRGVSEINSWGGETRQYQVLVDPRQLERYALTLRHVFQALADNNATFGGGFIEHRSERYTVRGIELAQTVDDLRNIVVSSVEGTPIYVRDVAAFTLAVKGDSAGVEARLRSQPWVTGIEMISKNGRVSWQIRVSDPDLAEAQLVPLALSGGGITV